MMTNLWSTDQAPALSRNALRFAHVSDLHLPHRAAPDAGRSVFPSASSACGRGAAGGRCSARRSSTRCATTCARIGLDHIVVTGDITNFSLPAEFTAGSAAGCDGLARAGVEHRAGQPRRAGSGAACRRAWDSWIAGCAAWRQWPYVHRHGRGVVHRPVLRVAHRAAAGLGSPRERAAARAWSSCWHEEGAAGQHARSCMLHHPVADGAVVAARKALADRGALRAVLRRAGAELVLHGHARDARLDALPGPPGPIPCLCVPSSSALPNPHDEAARWHLVTLPPAGGGWARVLVRQWSSGAARRVRRCSPLRAAAGSVR